jgi:hypothetical protein
MSKQAFVAGRNLVIFSLAVHPEFKRHADV